MNPIVDIGSETIDISKVVRVSRLGGDPSFIRYTVYFINGGEMNVYETRREHYPVMPRDQFISIWRQFNLVGDQTT